MERKLVDDASRFGCAVVVVVFRSDRLLPRRGKWFRGVAGTVRNATLSAIINVPPTRSRASADEKGTAPDGAAGCAAEHEHVIELAELPGPTSSARAWR
jgi:hypothetical protein